MSWFNKKSMINRPVFSPPSCDSQSIICPLLMERLGVLNTCSLCRKSKGIRPVALHPRLQDVVQMICRLLSIDFFFDGSGLTRVIPVFCVIRVQVSICRCLLVETGGNSGWQQLASKPCTLLIKVLYINLTLLVRLSLASDFSWF